VTNKGIYNIHKKSIKRNILISQIGGLTKTKSKSFEFTVHVPSSYDYRFSSPRRDEILDLIKRLYIIEHGQNCPCFVVDTKDLKAFTTTENDMKKSISRFPTSDLLCPEENLQVLDARDSQLSS
jgi:hypothetical protein